ncbi:MAG TPA: hypothetical protein VK974_04895 [Methylophilaceae bacterium]|nr:hypothetical protein [Methylophilaceae bacterium]
MTTTDIEVPADLFNPERMPGRDEFGFVGHPDADLIYRQMATDDEGEAAWRFIENLGYEYKVVSLEGDASEEICTRYFEGNSPDCSYWVPSKPEGEGWLLAWITDTEDGPAAVYVKKV